MAQPIKKFRKGSSDVTLWKNTGKLDNGKEFETVKYTLNNNFKVGEDWKSNNTFSRYGLLELRMLIDQALNYTVEKDEENTPQ